ncbi:MAG: hypothetical protein AB7F76_09595 [Parvibaculaceae bacterium]|jgi:hypothetical protein
MKIHENAPGLKMHRPPLSERELEKIAESNTVMARFYFNIRHSEGLIEDTEGQELRSLEEAHAEAVASARELIAEAVLLGEQIDHRAFEISDETGSTLDVVPFSEAMGRFAT